MTVRVLGIRHHGPGSARAVAAALSELDPTAVLIEGPADAGALIPLAGEDGMQPPVALLAYVPDEPVRAVFWPFAVFSPEWQALRWALARGAEVEFCDLPAAQQLLGGSGGASSDPLAELAAAGGYDDPETWWDAVIESGSGDPFDAITEAMAELRSGSTLDEYEARREAHMRSALRRAVRTHDRVAVVCGAWHAPALVEPLPTATSDNALLRGRPRRKVALTWVPWTHGRLAVTSGYGAGVRSPGWYHHLFSTPERTVPRWLASVAEVLRAEDLPVSTAHVIDAVRLADGLAGLRGRAAAGLGEVTDATRAVLAGGDEVVLDLVTRRLVVGEALGAVPESAPAVPLQADLMATARRLRLRLDPEERSLDLDLRRPLDLDRSRLLHRLDLLGIGWGTPGRSRSTGTFRESWTLSWQPGLVVSVITASTWGTTVEAAATAKLAGTAGGLDAYTAAVEQCLLADLPGALPDLLAGLDAAAAVDVQVAHLMSALPALARALRYGDVRGTDVEALARVAETLLVRICAGLAGAVVGLDDTAAAEAVTRLDAVGNAVGLLSDAEAPDNKVGGRAGDPAGSGAAAGPPGDGARVGPRERWLAAIAGLAAREDLPPLVAGRLVRMLLDAARIDSAEAGRRMGLALSVGPAPAAKAAWVEGFLSGGGLLLVHDADLLALVDGWLSNLPETEFVDLLPLLRRTFATFAGPERTAIADRLKAGPGRTVRSEVDDERGRAAVPTIARLLGLAE